MVGIAALLAGTLYLSLISSLPVVDGNRPLAGLEQRVTVRRDALGVATITAKSRPDLSRAIGFVHAQERFFQMDLQRRVAAGELSALFGPAALKADQQHRLHGLRAVARRALEGLPKDHRQHLHAYAEGVNAGLAGLLTPSFEYLLVRQSPEPWLPEDSLLAIYAMWFTLTDAEAERDLTLTRIHATVPADWYAHFATTGTDADAALDHSSWPKLPLPGPQSLDLRNTAIASNTPLDPDTAPAFGSNAFAVSGFSATGGAILANDMHLTLSVPNIWYRVRMQSPGLDGSGVTLPGAPVLTAGSNGHIAWGFTNAYIDTSDRVLVEPIEGKPAYYRYNGAQRPFEVRTERIEVAGGEALELEVRQTVWGPVQAVDGQLHALRWAAHMPAFTNMKLMEFENARTVRQALELAADVGIPPQNLIVVDKDGNLAWTIIGAIAQRKPGVDYNKLLSGGDAPDETWAQLAKALRPRLVNPPSGLLWTANARTVGSPHIERLGDGGYRLGARAHTGR